ncbi:monocarboxylate transporter 12-like [Tropilaelaps mercedesae]|uniref:Monocarboxylate transporter 12-like n=1 Tax=Tropilaelaps mercedesae TaxID=418985 RepID=A0A1V9XMK8_9ACAR|nr:monocarboxylate transporter 12-like [Tropilaelaps mercedesae]
MRHSGGEMVSFAYTNALPYRFMQVVMACKGSYVKRLLNTWTPLKEESLGQKDAMENPYQDTRRSWLIACACAWNFFWLTIVNRSAGVMFICYQNEFDINRQDASWAFSLMDTVSSFTVEFPTIAVLVSVQNSRLTSVIAPEDGYSLPVRGVYFVRPYIQLTFVPDDYRWRSSIFDTSTNLFKDTAISTANFFSKIAHSCG